MKNHFAFRRICPPLTVLVATCLACASALGQGTPSPTRGQPKKEVHPNSSYVLEVVDGVLLTGPTKEAATLAKIADILRGLYPEANIALAPELGDVQVRDLKLRGTELPEALEALRVASGDAFSWQNGLPQNAPPPSSRPIDPSTGLPVPPAPPRGQSSLYILTRNDSDLGGNPRRMVEVFNLSGYLEQLGKRDEKDIAASLEKIKMIVGETLNQVMQGNAQASDQPSFQFHPGANLFIVIGPPQAIEVTRKVVNALPGVAGARAYPPPAANPAADEAFKRRYGLMPPAGVPGPAGVQPPAVAAPPAAK